MGRFPIILLFAWVLIGCDHILEDTQYASGYSEGKFRDVKAGMIESEVGAILGKPIVVTTQSWIEVWSYYRDGVASSNTNRTFRSTHISFSVPSAFTEFSFAPSGVVTNIAGDYLRDASIGLSRETVEAKWGKPQEVFSKPFARVFHFSRASAGGTYRMRQVHFDANGRVISVVAEMYYD